MARRIMLQTIFACSVAFSRSFQTAKATRFIEVSRGLRRHGALILRESSSNLLGSFHSSFSFRDVRLQRMLRGGSGLPNMPAGWLRKERLGIHSPYAQASMRHNMDHGVRQVADPNLLQELLLLCHLTFAPLKEAPGPISPEEVEQISSIVELLTPDDMGVAKPPSKPFRTIEYTEVFAGEHVTVCLFKLPAGAQLPMHDHPGMTVWSKVLWGEMAVNAFDRAESASQPVAEERGGTGSRLLGGLRPDRKPFQVQPRRQGEVWGPESGVQVTEPDEGNIHQFTAVTPCCVLDVLAPPYDFGGGRPCTFYQVDSRPDGSFWARPVRCPDSYVRALFPTDKTNKARVSAFSATLSQRTRTVPYTGITTKAPATD